MGKAKRKKPSQIGPKVSLEQDIEGAKFATEKNRNKIRLRQDETEQYVDPKISRKILSAARKQVRELEEDFETTPAEASSSKKKVTKLDASDSDSDVEDEDNFKPIKYDDNIELNEDDERAMELFMSKNPAPRRTLADIIMEKITEKNTELDTQFSDAGSLELPDVDPRIIKIFEGVRDVLKRYRSGKLPKAFKTIPNREKWELYLHITEPPTWSAAAMYQGTRIFMSNLTEKMAEKYLNLVLLPRIRDDLAEYKRLNFHLYQALNKALFKPNSFMKGLLLPLLESGDCTLREAIIIGTVVARNSIPILVSCVAMYKIAEMDYTGANSIFLRIFLDKKYALPFKVVDACFHHFLRFQHDPREMPVLWHQALLTFVQRYKSSISTEQRDSLLELLLKQSHYQVTPEIRRELENARCRGEETAEPLMDFD